MKNFVPQPARNLTGPPVKVDRKLPPHELNARRNRKRNITQLPGIICLSPVSSFPSVGELLNIHEAGSSVNNRVYNPATNPVNDYEA